MSSSSPTVVVGRICQAHHVIIILAVPLTIRKIEAISVVVSELQASLMMCDGMQLVRRANLRSLRCGGS